MATYINYGEGEDDAIVQGAEWLQGIIQNQQGEKALEEFTEKFKDLHTDADNARQYDSGPVFDLFINYSEDLFTCIPESRGEDKVKEVESFYALVLSMLLMTDNADHLDRSTSRLCKLFSSNTEQQPELRLRLLMMLYNTFNNPAFEHRYRVFKHILDYSAEAQLFDQVLPCLDYLDAWMVDWEPYLKQEDKRTLFTDISRYMRDLKRPVDAFLYLKKYHLLFQGTDDKELNSKTVQDASLQLLKDALQLPSVMQFDDILAFDTVKALKKSEHGELVKLCEVFYSGDVQDLRNFQNKNQKIFDDNGIDFKDAMSKMRLLTLATLVHGKSEILLCDVAKALNESEDNVERWVVKALSEGVIDGRIDQLNHKVLVKSSFQRKFEKEEWAFLDNKLTTWIDNLENVIRFIGEQKKNMASQMPPVPAS